MLRQQALPSRMKLKQHSTKNQASSKHTPQGIKKTTPGQRYKQSIVTPEHIRRQSCPNQTSLQKRHQVQSMPEVLTSTKPPVVFSPQHSHSKNQKGSRRGCNRLSIDSRLKHSEDVLPNVAFRKRSSSTYNTVSDNLRGRILTHTRNRSINDTRSSTSTVPSRSSDDSDISVGLNRMSLDSKSAYGYVYDNVPRHSIEAIGRDNPKPHHGSKRASRSSSSDKTMVSPSHSSDGYNEPDYKVTKAWKTLVDSATVCMGEDIIFEGENSGNDFSACDILNYCRGLVGRILLDMLRVLDINIYSIQ